MKRAKKVHECDRCDYSASTAALLRTHLAYSHDIRVTWHECDHCGRKFKDKSTLNSHRKGVHEIGLVKKRCLYCGKEFKFQKYLNRHVKQVHEMGLMKIKCDHCDYKAKSKCLLKKHIQYVHNIGLIMVKCDHCDKKFKDNSNLKRHLQQVHEIGIKKVECSYCHKNFKGKDVLKRHIRQVHGINLIMLNCPHCDTKCKDKSLLKRHIRLVHEIDLVKLECLYCDSKFKTKSDLNVHVKRVHGVDLVMISCDYCDSQFKAQSKLNRHLTLVHDIGKYKCDFCLGNRNSSIDFKDSAGHHKICRDCYNKKTGKNSRVEKRWSDYLDKVIGKEYLLGSDKSLKAMGGCSLRRPDKLYVGLDLVELDECDEYQHLKSNYSVSCEDKRLDEIYSQEGIMGKKMVVIRWNPHEYTPPLDQKKKTRKERLEIHVALKKHLRNRPQKDLITVYYLFYDKDSPLISKAYPSKMIYSLDDFDEKC